ncbi:MAG: DUF4293 domain-containing protein [Aureispira sp.]|nr:DUF4293 domain-containing protein [Aureispira sp.]
MIQRIQSIYLLLSSAFTSLLFMFPIASAEKTADGAFQDGVLNLDDSGILLGLAIAVSALAFLAIFLFKNRILQMNLGKLNMLLAVGLLVFAIYLLMSAGVSWGLGIGLFVPLVSLILIVMANRAIGQDEALVKSADRIR